MKTLILPIEIFRREIDGRLLHALIAAREGWDVIIGANLEINRNIWRLPKGVYLFSTLTHKRYFLAKLLKNMGYFTQGWDEEGLVYLSRDLYLARRVSSHTLKFIDQIFAWGEASQKDLLKKASIVNKKVYAIGNPRIDLLRLNPNYIYKEYVNKIKSKYGNFILINTNFSSVNFIEKSRIVYNKKTETYKDEEKMKDLYKKLYNHRKFMFKKFMEAIPTLAKKLPKDMKIIIRPHPGENINTWIKAFKKQPNIKVISEGPIIPWLIAAKAIIHNDCTTAIEAFILKCPPIAFIPPDMPQDGVGILPNSISYQAKTISELVELIEAATLNALQPTEEQKKIFNFYISGINGPLAAEQAVYYAERLINKNNVSYSTKKEINARIIAFFRHIWKEITPRGWASRKYISKVYPKGQEIYIQERLNDIAKVLNMNNNFIKFEKIGPKIYKISYKK